jgi:hypothetical protein
VRQFLKDANSERGMFRAVVIAPRPAEPLTKCLKLRNTNPKAATQVTPRSRHNRTPLRRPQAALLGIHKCTYRAGMAAEPSNRL